MGASILKAVKLSLKVEESYANCKTEIQTSSEPTIIDIKNEVKEQKAIYQAIQNKLYLFPIKRRKKTISF